jgi:hypothetical protein
MATPETDTYCNRAAGVPFNVGPIPFTARYITAASTNFLYVQFDRVLTSVSTTAADYTIAGTSSPTVTTVTFTAGKNFLRLTLSGTIPAGEHTLSIATNAISDGTSSNIVTTVVI